jgi:predicted hotdog family 3-hydroxylacyl-ACP dehydratase
MNVPIGRPEIARLLPHAGAMCLLDSVLMWNSTKIVCMASSHRDRDHPLANRGRLDSVCGIEYAAQAMAVHGGLVATGGTLPRAGLLASVREVACQVARFDLLRDDLEVSATKLAGDAAGALYAFAIRCGADMIMNGRAAVVIDAASVGE